jgi:hypothetical protein
LWVLIEYQDFFSLSKEHIEGIICKNYTPNGVVVEVDVVPTKFATNNVIVFKDGVRLLLFDIHFKSSIF